MAIKEHQNLSYFVNDEEKKIENFIEDENKFLEGLEAIDPNSWDEVKELLEKGYKVVLFDDSELENVFNKVSEKLKDRLDFFFDKINKQNPNQ